MQAVIDRPTPPSAESEIRVEGRARWPLAGAVAGITGLAASLLAIQNLTEEQYGLGVDVVDELDRGGYHAGFLIGLISCAALLVAAAGWRRWANRVAPESLAAGYVASGLTATATINVIGFSLMGSMALYLPGGMDEGWLSTEGIFANFTYLDFGALLGWWTTLFAAGAVAFIAFGKARLLPRWMGVVSILLCLPPVIFAVTVALPGFAGLTMPLWLTVISLGMAFSRTAKA